MSKPTKKTTKPKKTDLETLRTAYEKAKSAYVQAKLGETYVTKAKAIAIYQACAPVLDLLKNAFRPNDDHNIEVHLSYDNEAHIQISINGDELFDGPNMKAAQLGELYDQFLIDIGITDELS